MADVMGQEPGIFQRISQVLGLQGSQDAAQPMLQPEMVAPAQPSFAPQGMFDPTQVQQIQSAPEAPTAKMMGTAPMDESKQQRLLLLSAALMSPGGIQDKLRLAALSQTAYTELQNAAGRDDLAKQAEAQRLLGDSESNRALRGEQAAESRQRREESAAKAPIEISKLRADADKAELEYERASKVYAAAMKLDPTGEKSAKAAQDLEEARVKLENARINQANAGAAEHNARTAGVKQENAARDVLASPTATPEEITRATTTLNKGKTGVAAKKDSLTLMAEMYKKANPNATEQEAAQYVLEADAGTKGETLRAATALYQNATDDATRKAAEDTLVALTRKSAGKTGAAGSVGGTTTPINGKLVEGQTATNPKTKERMIVKDGKWQPLK
jgi:hypothetical protein